MSGAERAACAHTSQLLSIAGSSPFRKLLSRRLSVGGHFNVSALWPPERQVYIGRLRGAAAEPRKATVFPS